MEGAPSRVIMREAVAGGGAVLSPASVRGANSLRRRVRRAQDSLLPDLLAELPDGLPQLGEGLRQEPQGQANRSREVLRATRFETPGTRGGSRRAPRILPGPRRRHGPLLQGGQSSRNRMRTRAIPRCKGGSGRRARSSWASPFRRTLDGVATPDSGGYVPCGSEPKCPSLLWSNNYNLEAHGGTGHVRSFPPLEILPPA